jgi:broad specificity phosphatase PhoE
VDIPLNATGRWQAQVVARRLQRWRLSALYSSDLCRAADTATIIGAAIELPVHTAAAWRERHGGIFQGYTNAERQKRFPEEAARFAANDALAPPEGESAAELRARAWDAFESLLLRHNGETIGVVSHGGTIMAVVSHVLGLPATVRPRLSLRGNTGLTVVEQRSARLTLTLLNDIAHLEGAASAA